MSNPVSQPSASVAFDPFACVECGNRYSAENSEFVPMGLSCGHTLCTTCADACTLLIPPICTICKTVVAGDGVQNTVLGAFCDESLHETSSAADCGAAEGGEDEEEDSRVVKKSRSSLHPSVAPCSAHGDEPAEYFCNDHYLAACEECAEDHNDCYEKVPIESVDWMLSNKTGLFRAVAHAATAASTKNESFKVKLQGNCDAAVEKVVNTISDIKVKLDELCATKVAEIRKLAADRLKQLDVIHDELLVRASQLNAGAALCDSAIDTTQARMVDVLSSLRAFDKLAKQPVVDGRKLAEIRFAGNVQEAATVSFETLTSSLHIRSTDEHITAAGVEDALNAIRNVNSIQSSNKVDRILTIMNDFAECAKVQELAFEALGALFRTDAAAHSQFMSSNGLNKTFTAMSAHLSSVELQRLACSLLEASRDAYYDMDIPVAVPTLMAIFEAYGHWDDDVTGEICMQLLEGLQRKPGYAEAMLAYRGEDYLRQLSNARGMGFVKKVFEPKASPSQNPLVANAPWAKKKP